MNRTATLTAALAGLALAGLALAALAPGASAAPTARLWAQESVRIRVEPSPGSTALGLLPKGASAAATTTDGRAYSRYIGGRHNACGSKGTIHDDQWNRVTYRGATGYVPEPCMLPFKP